MASTFLDSIAVLEGARAAMKVGAVSKGERVGFICDLRVEPEVIYAFFAAAKELGATPFLCMVERGSGYGPPDEFLGAIETANVLYFSREMANSVAIKALRQERGVRCVGFPHCRTASLLADEAVRFPLDLLSALYPKTWDVFRCGKDVEVAITDPKGTDFRVLLTRENIEEKFREPRYSGQIVANRPGMVSHLPVGHGPNILSPSEPLNETSEGTVRLDAINPAAGVYRGWSGDAAYQEPVTCHIKGGKILRVEGGREALIFDRIVGKDFDNVLPAERDRTGTQSQGSHIPGGARLPRGQSCRRRPLGIRRGASKKNGSISTASCFRARSWPTASLLWTEGGSRRWTIRR